MQLELFAADQTLPPELTGQLIAYIGNKRRLLPFLCPIFTETAGRIISDRNPAERWTASGTNNGDISFLDPMCGSGAVSRLARHLGFVVAANDWEHYAYTVTAARLETTPGELVRLFSEFGGIRNVLDHLNGIGAQAASGGKRGYIATNFAPRCTQNPRLGAERLFYTTENACFIDAVRDEIDRMFPADDSPDTGRIRRLLVSLVVYEASNHANTSGVFKAYHRGFGGLGRDALGRILAPASLELPSIPDRPPGEAFNLSASTFLRQHSGDICYLDPPYNSHQYGSNYFLLNSVSRWDKPPVPQDRDENGNLTSKAGIRSDWRNTRSEFCYRDSASAAFRDLLANTDARAVMVSYSQSGVLTAEELADMLSESGDVHLYGSEYTAYRGGRQSPGRVNTGRELVFVSFRGRAPGRNREWARKLLLWSVRELLVSRFVPDRLRDTFQCSGTTIHLLDSASVETPDYYQLGAATGLEDCSRASLEALSEKLLRCRCSDHGEEFEVLLGLIRTHPGKTRAYERRILVCLRKLAHRKYQELFFRSVAMLEAAVASSPDELTVAARGLPPILHQARLRFGE